MSDLRAEQRRIRLAGDHWKQEILRSAKVKNWVESKRLFRDRKWIKKTYLPCISLCFGVCLFFQWIFRFRCVTMATVTPFIRGSQGWSLRCGRVLDHSQQKCHFFAEILIRFQIFQLQPKKKSLSPFEVVLAVIGLITVFDEQATAWEITVFVWESNVQKFR